MSAFDGHPLEYPNISIDRFVGSNLYSSAYFLSHCHKDHIEGLLEDTFFERLKKGAPNVWLYTSETTKNLLSCDNDMKHLIPYVVGIPVHQPKEIIFETGNKGRDSVVVTLISAGHCVGSVMILFEGKEGTVLYTGDFRLSRSQLEKVDCLHAGQSVRCLQSIYVDTTFCVPTIPNLPSRETTKDVLIDIIQRWIERGKNHIVHLKCKGKYGYEYIMKEVAKHFKVKIHVNKWRLEMSKMLPDMLQYFTTDSNNTQIHCCYYGNKSTSSYTHLPCHQDKENKNYKMITIIPSSLYFVKQYRIPKDFRKYIPHLNLWRVVHSMHASYDEIREVIGYLKPKNIYPFVPPVDSQDIMVAYQRLQDLKKETSLELSPKKNEVTTDFLGSFNMQNNLLLSPKTANQQYANLGLDSTLCHMQSPPPMRSRRRKSRNKNNLNKSIIENIVNNEENIEIEINEVNITPEIYTTNELLEEAFGVPVKKSQKINSSRNNVSDKSCDNNIINLFSEEDFWDVSMLSQSKSNWSMESMTKDNKSQKIINPSSNNVRDKSCDNNLTNMFSEEDSWDVSTLSQSKSNLSNNSIDSENNLQLSLSNHHSKGNIVKVTPTNQLASTLGQSSVDATKEKSVENFDFSENIFVSTSTKPTPSLSNIVQGNGLKDIQTNQLASTLGQSSVDAAKEKSVENFNFSENIFVSTSTKQTPSLSNIVQENGLKDIQTNQLARTLGQSSVDVPVCVDATNEKSVEDLNISENIFVSTSTKPNIINHNKYLNSILFSDIELAEIEIKENLAVLAQTTSEESSENTIVPESQNSSPGNDIDRVLETQFEQYSFENSLCRQNSPSSKKLMKVVEKVSKDFRPIQRQSICSFSSNFNKSISADEIDSEIRTENNISKKLFLPESTDTTVYNHSGSCVIEISSGDDEQSNDSDITLSLSGSLADD